MYADKMTGSMQTAIDETNRRRALQMEYNEKHGITPTTVIKSVESIMGQTKVADSKNDQQKYYIENEKPNVAADPVIAYMDKEGINKLIVKTRKSMEVAAKDLNFVEAARLRDEMFELQKLMDSK